jgi:membrane protease YdiL (CAAX protease family)
MRKLRWLDGVLIFGISYLVSSVVVIPLINVLALREVTAVSVAVLIGISYVWVRAITGSPAEYVGVGAVSPRILALTVVGSLAIMIPAMSLEAVVLERFQAPPEVIHALEDLIRARTLPQFLYAILVAAVGASVSEEFVFRGILQNSLSPRVGRWAGLMMATTIFALLHTLWRFPGAFVLGMFLGLLYMRTGSLVPGLVSHTVINATSVVLFNMAERSTSGPIPMWVQQDRPAPLWLTAVASAVFLLSFAALWRETEGEPYPLPHGQAEGDFSGEKP